MFVIYSSYPYHFVGNTSGTSLPLHKDILYDVLSAYQSRSEYLTVVLIHSQALTLAILPLKQKIQPLYVFCNRVIFQSL